MWAVIKIDRKKIGLLKSDLNKKLRSETLIYSPKTFIKISNKKIIKEIHLLGDYIFCFNKNFNKTEVIKDLKFIRGIKYFLEGYLKSQKEIETFIHKCKNSENKEGYVSSNFFNLNFNNEYKFSNGPFANSIFRIIEFQKNRFKILVGSLKTTIKKKDYLFRPV